MKLKNILLIRPNCTNDKKDTYITFPLGLGYIASVLDKNGYNVKIMDLTIDDFHWFDFQDEVEKFKPDVIGITALSSAYKQVKKLSYHIRDKFNDIPQILGGHLATHSYDTVLKNTCIDVCVIGEGELTITDLMKNLDSLNKVNGIAYKILGDGCKVILNEPRELIKDLSKIPYPAYDKFDLDKYTELTDVYMSKKHLGKNKQHKVIAMEAGRGCPFSCNFCSKMFKKVRKRRVRDLVNEMTLLYYVWDIDTFWFQDELLFSDKEYMKEFCEAIKDLDIAWYGNSRVDSIDKEIIQLAFDNKCLSIAYGVETGSRQILKNMNKKITPEKIIKTLKDSLDVGITINMGLIVGYPGENKSTIQETVDVLNEVGYPGLKFRYVTPYPGSKLYNDCLHDGLIKNEDEYLTSLGDGTGTYRFRINMTEMSDEELTNILRYTSDKVLSNYIKYLFKHPMLLFKRIFQKDVMNPLYIYYNRIFNPTNYDKALK